MGKQQRLRTGALTERGIKRVGYAWMMHCLRAIERASRGEKREIEMTVKACAAETNERAFRAFVERYEPAAKEAVELIATDLSFRAEYRFQKPVPRSRKPKHRTGGWRGVPGTLFITVRW